MVDTLSLMVNGSTKSIEELLATNVDFSCSFILKSYARMIRDDFLTMASGFVAIHLTLNYH